MTPESIEDFEVCIEAIFSILSKNDLCYLRMAYQVILGREADPDGLKFWDNQLKSGMSRNAVIDQMMQSIEFQTLHPSGTEFLTPTGRVLVELPEFKIWAMTNDSAVGSTIIKTKNYEPHLTKAILKHLNSDDVFLDIGANIGYFTLLAASIVKDAGKVISFEPNPENLQFLYSSIVENQFDNITIYPFAASISRQILTLTNGGSSSRIVDADVLPKKSCYFVPSMAVDELLQHEKQINVIKIDVEGHEPLAICGMDRLIKKHKPIIFTEFHPWLMRSFTKTEPQEYLEQIVQYGYRLSILQFEGLGGEITEAPDTTFVMNFWQNLGKAMNYDKIHLDLMALPL